MLKEGRIRRRIRSRIRTCEHWLSQGELLFFKLLRYISKVFTVSLFKLHDAFAYVCSIYLFGHSLHEIVRRSREESSDALGDTPPVKVCRMDRCSMSCAHAQHAEITFPKERANVESTSRCRQPTSCCRQPRSCWCRSCQRVSSQCQGCTSLCSAAPASCSSTASVGSCRYAVPQESRVASFDGQLGFQEEGNPHACSSKQKQETAHFHNPYAQNLLPETKRDECQVCTPAAAAEEETNYVFRSDVCPLAEKLTNEEQVRKPSPDWPGLSESVTSHEDNRWRHRARILEAIGDHAADVENIIQRWNYRHKKFRGQPAAAPDASLHELLPLSGSSGRQSVIMVNRKKVETAGSCPKLLPPVEGDAAGTGLEDVLLERNDADDVQGRVARIRILVHLSLLHCSIRIKAFK